MFLILLETLENYLRSEESIHSIAVRNDKPESLNFNKVVKVSSSSNIVFKTFLPTNVSYFPNLGFNSAECPYKLKDLYTDIAREIY